MNTHIRQIPVESIDPSPFQTRRFTHGSKDLRELAASIKAIGVLEPVLVRPGAGDRFELLAGERRCRASKLAGLEAVPAIVRELDDDQAIEVTVTENLQRQDLHPLDEAAAIDLLMQRFGDVFSVAARLGRTESFVARRARLCALTEAWRAAIAGSEEVVVNVGGVCRGCGCTDEEACEFGCSWVEPDLCSQCADDEPGATAAGGGFAHWGVGHLEVVARLAPADQDAFLQQELAHHFKADRLTVRDVARMTAAWLRRLDEAPWELDDSELLEDAGPCGACPLRASVNPGLFDNVALSADGGGVPAGDRCLSASCWDRKLGAQVARSLQQLENDGQEPVRLTTRYDRRNDDNTLHQGYETRVSPEPKRGYKPAVAVDGPSAGKVVYVKRRRLSSSSGSRGPKKGPLTMKEKRERLRRRRYALAIPRAHDALAGSPLNPSDDALLVLAAAIGTHDTVSYRPGRTSWGEWSGSPAKGGLHGSLASQLPAGATEPVRCALWSRQLLPVILQRTKYSSHIDIDAAWAELEAVAGLVGAGGLLRQIMQHAIEEIPEPKSWGEAA